MKTGSPFAVRNSGILISVFLLAFPLSWSAMALDPAAQDLTGPAEEISANPEEQNLKPKAIPLKDSEYREPAQVAGDGAAQSAATTDEQDSAARDEASRDPASQNTRTRRLIGPQPKPKPAPGSDLSPNLKPKAIPLKDSEYKGTAYTTGDRPPTGQNPAASLNPELKRKIERGEQLTPEDVHQIESILNFARTGVQNSTPPQDDSCGGTLPPSTGSLAACPHYLVEKVVKDRKGTWGGVKAPLEACQFTSEYSEGLVDSQFRSAGELEAYFASNPETSLGLRENQVWSCGNNILNEEEKKHLVADYYETRKQLDRYKAATMESMASINSLLGNPVTSRLDCAMNIGPDSKKRCKELSNCASKGGLNKLARNAAIALAQKAEAEEVLKNPNTSEENKAIAAQAVALHSALYGWMEGKEFKRIYQPDLLEKDSRSGALNPEAKGTPASLTNIEKALRAQLFANYKKLKVEIYKTGEAAQCLSSEESKWTGGKTYNKKHCEALDQVLASSPEFRMGNIPLQKGKDFDKFMVADHWMGLQSCRRSADFSKKQNDDLRSGIAQAAAFTILTMGVGAAVEAVGAVGVASMEAAKISTALRTFNQLSKAGKVLTTLKLANTAINAYGLYAVLSGVKDIYSGCHEMLNQLDRSPMEKTALPGAAAGNACGKGALFCLAKIKDTAQSADAPSDPNGCPRTNDDYGGPNVIANWEGCVLMATQSALMQILPIAGPKLATKVMLKFMTRAERAALAGKLKPFLENEKTTKYVPAPENAQVQPTLAKYGTAILEGTAPKDRPAIAKGVQAMENAGTPEEQIRGILQNNMDALKLVVRSDPSTAAKLPQVVAKMKALGFSNEQIYNAIKAHLQERGRLNPELLIANTKYLPAAENAQVLTILAKYGTAILEGTAPKDRMAIANGVQAMENAGTPQEQIRGILQNNMDALKLVVRSDPSTAAKLPQVVAELRALGLTDQQIYDAILAHLQERGRLNPELLIASQKNPGKAADPKKNTVAENKEGSAPPEFDDPDATPMSKPTSQQRESIHKEFRDVLSLLDTKTNNKLNPMEKEKIVEALFYLKKLGVSKTQIREQIRDYPNEFAAIMKEDPTIARSLQQTVDHLINVKKWSKERVRQTLRNILKACTE